MNLDKNEIEILKNHLIYIVDSIDEYIKVCNYFIEDWCVYTITWKKDATKPKWLFKIINERREQLKQSISLLS